MRVAAVRWSVTVGLYAATAYVLFRVGRRARAREYGHATMGLIPLCALAMLLISANAPPFGGLDIAAPGTMLVVVMHVTLGLYVLSLLVTIVLALLGR